MCRCDALSASSSLKTPIESGTKSGSRTRLFSVIGASFIAIDSRSAARTVPSTLSSDPLQTTNCPWLWPLRNSRSWSSVALTSTHSMSSRGVMMAPMRWSPTRKTRCTRLSSFSSSAPLSAPWLMTARISSSVRCGSIWPLMPNTRSTRLVEPVSSDTSGDPTRASACIGIATHEAMVSGWFRPIRFGTSSPMMSDR